jgi:hypothetical protein
MDDNEIGALIAICGTASPYLGCNCEHHSICGTVVHLDMLVGFKKTVVTTGKLHFKVMVNPHQHLTHHFPITENDKYKTILGAFWITEGICRCIIGHVPDTFAAHFATLDGQVGQIVTLYQFSSDPRKIAFSNMNLGVCHAILVDKCLPGDEVIDSLVQIIDSDDESD